MSLTRGFGPLARPQAGHWNVDLSAAPKHLLYLHDIPQRIRGLLDGETVVDTERATLLHETRLMPQWYLPIEDIRQEFLVPSDTTTYCPFKGTASYWSLRVGDRVVEDAIWTYREPLPETPPIAGLAGFYFDRLDGWLEEDEPVFGHPRDPFHRVDLRRTSRQVVVRADGKTVAETTGAIAFFETGLPVRYYLPEADVDPSVLTPSDTTTVCAYKGTATYRHLTVGDTTIEDAVWTYLEPLDGCMAVAGLLSFHGDGIEVEATKPGSAG